MTDREPVPHRWPLIVLAVLAIAGLAFAIGRFSTFGASTTAPATDSAEAGFARDMQVHHAQAVDMAMQIHRTTDDDQLRALAYDIATGQSAQRGEMYDWLVQWGLPQAGEPLMSWMADDGGAHADHDGTTAGALDGDDAMAAMGMASDAELDQLRTLRGAQADCLFLKLMIRHHEGALPMVDAVVRRGSEPRVLTVAGSIKNGQMAEIDAMQSMRERLGCGA